MDDARYLEDGNLVIYRRTHNYYARIRTGPKSYIWRSLKTDDPRQAEKTARKLFYTIEDRAEQGLPTQSKTFGAVIAEYVKYREKDNKQGRTKDEMLRQIKRVVKFWIAYAGKKPVEHIDDKVMREFIPWRKEYYSKLKVIPKNARLNPTDKTLQWEFNCGKSIIKWAHEQGYRGNKPVLTATFTPKKKRVRPAFEIEGYRKLWRMMQKRINDVKDKRIKRSRELLRSYVLILANSGMRVGEANNLRMRDVIPFKDDKGRRNYRFIVRGKTGERDVILRANAASHVDRHLKTRDGAGENDWFFAMPDGGKIITLMDQFDEVLKQAKISNNGFGEKFTLYSLRHFYAVMALRKGLGVFEVSRNMGTSVQMIQQYYGRQATAAVFATRLGD